MNQQRAAGGPDDRAAQALRFGTPAPAPVAVDVGIVAALGLEVGFLIDQLTAVRKYSGPHQTVIEGECAGKLVALVIAGVGPAAARRGAELLLAGHRPRWLLSAGFAGALDPALPRYALVMPREVVDLQGRRYAIDVTVPEGPPGPGRITTGRLLTVDRIIARAAEKAELRRQYEADLVDMETAAVARLCSERSVRFLSIRVISDEATVDLPPEIVTLLSRTGSYRIGAALRAVWNRPSRIKDLWTLHEHAQEAADRLAQFTVLALGKLD